MSYEGTEVDAREPGGARVAVSPFRLRRRHSCQLESSATRTTFRTWGQEDKSKKEEK